MNLQIINPIDYPGWDDLLLSSCDESFFHTSAWASVLAESYSYRPLYFTQISDNRISILFTVMAVNSFLTGKRGVCLPFTDFCSPIITDAETFKAAIKHIINYGRNAGWKYIDFRGGAEHMQDAVPSLSHYAHDLDLKQDEKQLFDNLRDNTRRNIKKAFKEGLEVRLENSFESVKEFFRLNCMTRKRHGLPPQPYRFFKKIYEHVISKKKGFVSLAVHKEKIIAGAVFFHFGKEAIYKYGASDMGYSHLRPNNLVMWEAIKWYLNNGFENFSFGITEPENEGLLQFKRSWGAKEKMINYYKYNIGKAAFEKDEFRGRTSYTFFQKMPLPLLKLTGALIYRHFG
jgi:hypothetical protein